MSGFMRFCLNVVFLVSLTIPVAQADTIRIGMVLPDFTQNQLILDLHDQAQSAAKEEGVELLVTGRGAAEEQVAAVENYVAAKTYHFGKTKSEEVITLIVNWIQDNAPKTYKKYKKPAV